MENSKKVLDILFRFDVNEADPKEIAHIQELITAKSPTEEVLQEIKTLVELNKFKSLQNIKDFYIL